MVGLLGHVGIGVESTWGSPVAPVDYMEILNEGLVTEIERFEVANVIAGLHEPDDQDGLRRHEGDMVLAAHPANIGHIIRGVMGVNSLTAVGSDLFLNQFTMARASQSSLHPLVPYTVEVFRPGAGTEVATSFRFSGAQFSTLEFGMAPNQDLRATGGLIAKDSLRESKTTPTFPGSPVNFFTWDQASLSLGGLATGDLEAFALTIDNQLEGTPTLKGATSISKVRRTGAQLITLSATSEFLDFADYDRFRQQVEQPIVVTLAMPSSFQLIMDMPRCVFTEYPVEIAGRDRITVDWSMKARYHQGSASAISISLTTTNTF